MLTAKALPLTLSTKIAQQPAANTLPLPINRKLGEAASNTARVTANALPLPLTNKVSEQPAANKLPLPLTRKLGTAGTATPIEPPQPTTPKPPRRMGAFGCMTADVSQAQHIAQHEHWQHGHQHIAQSYKTTFSPAKHIRQCSGVRLSGFVPLSQCSYAAFTASFLVKQCQSYIVLPFVPLTNCSVNAVSSTVGFVRCATSYSAAVVQHQQCNRLPLQPVKNLANATSGTHHSHSIAQCRSTRIQEAVPVPCRFYPIPGPPPVKPVRVCRVRPPASRLPIMLKRKRQRLPSSSLPLPLQCWHDEPVNIIPSLRSYIMHNVIAATVGGISVEPLSFNIKTDMNSYCWQGSIDITAKDFAKLKTKLAATKGSEPMINVTINNRVFSFIAEELSRSRAFVNHTHNISGRSITARLGADYAKAQTTGLLTQASYASQIINQQLAGLAITADFNVADWLIPANAYAVSGKTPLAVINDIAKACGGFVVSDISQPRLAIKKRWQSAAWELAAATPAVTMPADIIRRMDDKKRTNPRYNTVTLVGSSEGGTVYRQQQSRDLDAPTQESPLYTAKEVIIPAGIAILSDSGTHADYSVTLRWADKYSIPLAQLGQIWQINDPEGAWRGVVTGVSVSLSHSNDAPVVWQTVNIDRYLDV